MGYVGLPPDRIGSYFAYTGTPNSNGCGQAAVATLLEYWHRNPYPPGADLVSEIYKRHPPDTRWDVLGWQSNFGTTPGHLENILKAYGFTTYGWCNNQGGARSTLERALARHRPTVVLLDFARLGREWFTLHWPIAYAYDDRGVHLTNMIRSNKGTDPRQFVPWDEFMHAWSNGLPSGTVQWAGIEAW